MTVPLTLRARADEVIELNAEGLKVTIALPVHSQEQTFEWLRFVKSIRITGISIIISFWMLVYETKPVPPIEQGFALQGCAHACALAMGDSEGGAASAARGNRVLGCLRSLAQDFRLDAQQVGFDAGCAAEAPEQGCQAQNEFAFDGGADFVAERLQRYPERRNTPVVSSRCASTPHDAPARTPRHNAVGVSFSSALRMRKIEGRTDRIRDGENKCARNGRLLGWR